MDLPRITPGLVGRYLDQLAASPPTRKLHLAALRGFFDALTLRHVVVLNTAARIGAVAGLRRGSLAHDGSQYNPLRYPN